MRVPRVDVGHVLTVLSLIINRFVPAQTTWLETRPRHAPVSSGSAVLSSLAHQGQIARYHFFAGKLNKVLKLYKQTKESEKVFF